MDLYGRSRRYFNEAKDPIWRFFWSANVFRDGSSSFGGACDVYGSGSRKILNATMPIMARTMMAANT